MLYAVPMVDPIHKGEPMTSRQAARDAEIAEARRQLEWLTTEGGMTLKDVAQAIGSYHATVSRWKHEKYDPTPRSCAYIRRLYEKRRAELNL